MKKFIVLFEIIITTLVSCSTDELETQHNIQKENFQKLNNKSNHIETYDNSVYKEGDDIPIEPNKTNIIFIMKGFF